MSDRPDYATAEYWNKRTRENRRDRQGMLFRDPRFLVYERRAIAAIESLLRPGMNVLDVACGFGRFTGIVNDKAFWTGVDFSEEMRSVWESDGGVGSFIVADVRTPEFAKEVPPSHFDLIFQVNSGKVLQMTPEEFNQWARPFLRRPGTIACLECDVFTIFQDYGTQFDHLVGTG